MHIHHVAIAHRFIPIDQPFGQVFWGPSFLNLGTTSRESRGTGGPKSPLKSRENRMVNHKSTGIFERFSEKKAKKVDFNGNHGVKKKTMI